MPKLLAEFLQEQQEPFALEVYLYERGYRKRLTLQSSAKHAVSPNCSYFLRDVFKQLVVASDDGGRRKVLMAKPKTRLKKNADGDGLSLENDDASHFSEAAIARFVKCGNCFLERGVKTNFIEQFSIGSWKRKLLHIFYVSSINIQLIDEANRLRKNQK